MENYDLEELKEQQNLASMCLLSWGMNEESRLKTYDDINKLDDELKSIIESFMCTNAVVKRLNKVFDIDIKIPIGLIMLLETISDCNPGYLQMVMKYILTNIASHVSGGKIPKGYLISPLDFGMCFPESFPCYRDQKWNKFFEEMWDEQKLPDGSNGCDTKSWWMDVFEE